MVVPAPAREAWQSLLCYPPYRHNIGTLRAGFAPCSKRYCIMASPPDQSFANLTPMLRQYTQAKAAHPDAMVLFRLGDFYEMFKEDAQQGARLLELVLTSREIGKGQRVPMCGVPVHAVETYIARLIRAGCKVAVCEQMEDPRLVRGLVRREVIRVLSPGTGVEGDR